MTDQLARPARTSSPPIGSRVARRRRAVGVVVALGVTAAGAAYVVTQHPGTCVTTPVAARAVSDLLTYTGWLREHHVQGYVGEVGWPSGADAAEWNGVASAWYAAADRSGLWVTAWAAGRWWPSSYRLAVYRLSGRDSAPVRGPQASVIEEHADVSGALRGVDLPSGAFAAGPQGAPGYGGSRSGRYGTDYYYEDAADYRQIAATGASVVRVSITWERLQHRLGAPLDPREVSRLRATLREAQGAGLAVVIDLHGYGDYWVTVGAGHRRLTLGSRALPDSRFADFWRRLSTALRGSPAVLGYGLMNEPTGLAKDAATGVRRWEAASQAAVDAIRSTGDVKTVFVSGYGGAAPGQWVRYHPQPWITDPAGQVRYEAHQYFDGDGTGHYSSTYQDETSRARAAGFTTACASASTSSGRG